MFRYRIPMSASSPIIPKPWRERRFTLPSLPGGTNSQALILKSLLTKLPCTSGSTIKWQITDGKEVSLDCEERCIHELSSLGLVVRDADDRWIPSRVASKWLESDDSYFLAGYLHANVKFFGELL